MKYTYEQLAKMIDHSLLHPTLTDQELEAGCLLAAKYGVGSVCIKPYAVKRAAEWLRGSGVLVGAVIAFPHGNSCTGATRCGATATAAMLEEYRKRAAAAPAAEAASPPPSPLGAGGY